MDTRIPLLGIQPDFAGSLQNGLQARQLQQQVQQQGAMNALYRQQGPAIAQGQPQALNALAQFDPAASQTAQMSALKIQDIKDQAKAAASAAAAKMTADQTAQVAAETEGFVRGAVPLYEAMKSGQPGASQQLDAYLAAHKIPATSQNIETVLYASQGALEALQAYGKMNPAPVAPEPLSAQGKFASDQKAGFVDPNAVYQSGATTIDLGGGTNKQVFDAMQASMDAANAAQTGLNAVTNAQAELPGAITGFGANQRLALAKIATYFGADPSAVTDTETFRSAIAPQIAATMKATVGSTQISNADREFAEKASGGSITLDTTSIARLLDIMKRADTVIIQRHNDRLNKVYPDNGQYVRERALFGVTAPQAVGAASEQTPAPAAPRQQYPGAPEVGAKDGNFTYLGGDPADPKSWQPNVSGQ